MKQAYALEGDPLILKIKGVEVKLDAPLMALFCIFNRAVGERLSHDDLVSRLRREGIACRSSATSSNLVWKLRQVLRHQKADEWIMTLPGFGYKFNPPVVEEKPAGSASKGWRSAPLVHAR